VKVPFNGTHRTIQIDDAREHLCSSEVHQNIIYDCQDGKAKTKEQVMFIA